MAVGTSYASLGMDTTLPTRGDFHLLGILQSRVTVKTRVHAFNLSIGDRGWHGFGGGGRCGRGRNLGGLMTRLTNIAGPAGVIVGNHRRITYPFPMTGQAIIAPDERVRNKWCPTLLYRHRRTFGRGMAIETILITGQGVRYR